MGASSVSSSSVLRTTRSGLATCIGPDGTLQWGPHNLLAEGCNNLDNTGAAPVANASLTTTTVALTTANGSYWYKATPVTFPVGTVLIFQALASCSVPRTACFRAANGTTGSANEAKTNVALTQTPQVVWVTLTVTTAAPISWGIDNRSLVGATDTGVTGVITITNVMCENVTGTNRTTPSDYVDSTVKNRRGFSNDFTNPTWAKGVVSAYPGMAALPDGTPATLLVPSATSGLQGVYNTATVTAGATHTDRLVFKYAGVRYIQLTLSSNEVTGNPRANFDLVAGSVTASDGGLVPSITPLGNGFYELSVTYVAALATATIWPIFIPSPTSARAASFAGDGVSGVYVAQAGLVPGSVPSYYYNAGPAPAVGAYYGQRTDYDPVTLACKGALIEPTQVTQLLVNPDNLSAAPWSGSIARTDDGTKINGRIAWKAAKTQASGSEALSQSYSSAVTGTFTTRVKFMASANSSRIDFGLYANTAGWGATGDTTAVIVSGPGTLAQNQGAWFKVTGLSTNVPTVISMTRNYLVSDIMTLNIYPDSVLSTTVGAFNYVQVDNLEAGTSPTSFIPNPASSGTVVRVADTSSVGYDDLCKALPWLMDSNVILSPDSVVTAPWTSYNVANGSPLPAITAPNGLLEAVGLNDTTGGYYGVSQTPAVAASTTNTFSVYVKQGTSATGFSVWLIGSGSNTLFQNTIAWVGGVPTAAGWVATPVGDGGWYRISFAFLSGASTSVACYLLPTPTSQAATGSTYFWGVKLNPGPIAQTYYPQSSKQGTIVFEGDLTYGSTAAVLFCLENTVSNRVLLYKPTAGNTLYGYINGNGVNSNQVITIGVPFKAAIGFSLASAGIAANGSSEAAITPGAFALAPNVLKIANDATNGGSGSVHLRRLRIFNTNLSAATKQSLTR